MSLFTRIQRGVKGGIRAFRGAPDFRVASEALDRMIEAGELPTIEKQVSTTSRRDVMKTTDDQVTSFQVFNAWRSYFMNRAPDKLPEYGLRDRDIVLSEFWKMEPILAGAVYSMSAKMSSMKWTITGPRLKGLAAAKLLARAEHMRGSDWGGFMSSSAVDFYTTNNGVFWEVARSKVSRDGKINRLAGNLSDIGHIDSLACMLTGNRKTPMVYYSELTGQELRFKAGQFISFTSLPSPREIYLGIGFCAVDRAYRAAKLLLGLHDYDEEKLSNLPPEGVAAVTGLTMDEFMDAVELWRIGRERDQSLTFPQVLWLIGSQPNVQVSIDFAGFSQIPESFDRQSVVSHYVMTLALDFGVDAREFWAISSGSLGTASESEIQHIKAKGKGPGEFISLTERHINAELPEGVDFGFDTQDIEEDMTAATVAKAWVDVFYPLYQGTPAGQKGNGAMGRTEETQFPKPPKKGMQEGQQPDEPQKQPGGVPQQGGMPGNFGAPTVEQVITKEQLVRLLADKGVLPDYLVSDERVAIEDSDIHIDKHNSRDDAKFVWDNGVLKEYRLPPVTISERDFQRPVQDEPVPAEDIEQKMLEYLKQKEDEIFEGKRSIRGKPIPEREVVRGASVTERTIEDELERWRKHPILSQYVPTREELEEVVNETQISV